MHNGAVFGRKEREVETIMISQDKLIRYASNFLNWEITELEQLLEMDDVSNAEKELFKEQLKVLKRDAEEIERE